MEIKKVLTKNAPIPAGHYSQAIIHNDLIYISGQIPVVPESGEKITGSVEDQTLQVLKNIKAIVIAAGSDITRILKVTVFISDISLWAQVNNTYLEFFGEHKPARSIVPVKDLHYGFKIEMEAIAAI